MHYDIHCSRCQASVTHECRTWPGGDHGEQIPLERQLHPNPIVHELVELLNWRPEGGFPETVVEAMKQSDWYDEGDEDHPFFTQAVIYPLLEWKDNGRSFFGQLHAVIRAAGFDPAEVKHLAHQMDVREKASEAQAIGGLVPNKVMEDLEWTPEVGWTVGLIVPGLKGTVASKITRVQKDERARYAGDCWVFLEGGGRCHLRRLMRICTYIQDGIGRTVWSVDDENLANPQQKKETA